MPRNKSKSKRDIGNGGNRANQRAAAAPVKPSPNSRAVGRPQPPTATTRPSISDWRQEKPDFRVELVRDSSGTRYAVRGKLDAPVPPLRESKYLDRKRSLELYRYMHLNR